ncbi:MAG: DUF2254 family protein [Halobacteriota archaeon]|nr:DUF2254 family protein [Halobacteriota archaeon]
MEKGAKRFIEAVKKLNLLDGIKKFNPPPYLFYLVLLIGLTCFTIVAIFHQFGTSNFFKSYLDLDSSRYLLSAMSQVLAAILALVVGFSFVAIQLSAHFGSPRVFDLFLKGRAFWCILTIFLFSIIYDFAILRILSEETLDLLVKWINYSVILVLISFLSLFPYTHITINQLKPKRIIKGIIKIKSDDVKSLERDTILPIVDLLNKAVIANDLHTLNVGLEALEELNLEIIHSSSIDGKDKLEIVKYYIGKISRLIEICIKENDESAVKDISDSLKNIGLKAIESRYSEVPQDYATELKSDKKYRTGVALPDLTDSYDNISNKIKNVLRDACKKVIEKEWGDATKSVLIAIVELQVKSRVENVSDLYDISWFCDEFSPLSKEKKIFSMKYFMEAIRDIGAELIEKGIFFNDFMYNEAVKSILEKSLEVLDGNDYNRIVEVTDYIIDIGIVAVKNDHNLKEDVKEHLLKIATSEKFSSAPIDPIGSRGFGLASNSKKPETIWICSCLGYIGSSCASEGLDEPTYRIFTFFEGIEVTFKNRFLERNDTESDDRKTDEALEVTDHIIKIIKEVGDISIEKGLERSSRDAFSSFIKIGMNNEDVDLRKRICENLKDMFQKGENREIFDSVIDTYEKGQAREHSIIIHLKKNKEFIDTYEKGQAREQDKYECFKGFCGFDKW